MTARHTLMRRVGARAACILPIGGAVLAMALWSGCSYTPKVAVSWQGGPFFKPTNYHGVAAMPETVRRVALLPLGGMESSPADVAASLENVARSALLAEGRFEVVPVSAELIRLLAGRPTVASSDLLPPALFERIARESGADAVLLIEVTTFRPYTPLSLGVRAKLARCDAARTILWAFDTVYDMRETAVSNSARRYTAGGSTGLVDPGPAAMQSPSRFAAYAFADAFATLPPRPLPEPPPTEASKVPPHRADYH